MLLPIDSKVKLCAWDALKEKSALSFLPPPPEYPLRCMAVRVNTPLPVGIAVPSSVPLHISFSVPVSSAVLTVALGLCAGNSPTALYRPLPTINGKVWLKVIVRIIRASVTNSYGMSMCTSLFGCFCALIRTPWSRSRFCTTRVVFFYKSKSMRVIPACTNRYIVVMGRQFSDSFMRYVST